MCLYPPPFCAQGLRSTYTRFTTHCTYLFLAAAPMCPYTLAGHTELSCSCSQAQNWSHMSLLCGQLSLFFCSDLGPLQVMLLWAPTATVGLHLGECFAGAEAKL